MTTQPFENAPQQPDTAKPAPECPPASIAPQNGVQGRKGADPNYQHGYRDGQNNYADRTQP